MPSPPSATSAAATPAPAATPGRASSAVTVPTRGAPLDPRPHPGSLLAELLEEVARARPLSSCCVTLAPVSRVRCPGCLGTLVAGAGRRRFPSLGELLLLCRQLCDELGLDLIVPHCLLLSDLAHSDHLLLVTLLNLHQLRGFGRLAGLPYLVGESPRPWMALSSRVVLSLVACR